MQGCGCGWRAALLDCGPVVGGENSQPRPHAAREGRCVRGGHLMRMRAFEMMRVMRICLTIFRLQLFSRYILNPKLLSVTDSYKWITRLVTPPPENRERDKLTINSYRRSRPQRTMFHKHTRIHTHNQTSPSTNDSYTSPHHKHYTSLPPPQKCPSQNGPVAPSPRNQSTTRRHNLTSPNPNRTTPSPGGTTRARAGESLSCSRLRYC